MNNPVKQDTVFYLTPEHDCSYLPNRLSMTIVIDPSLRITSDSYSKLAAQGFRRSGKFIYRPCCRTCKACIPVRIPVHRFELTRQFRRIRRINEDLTVTVLPVEYREDHFDLYKRYLSAQHAGGGMDDPAPEDYHGFLCSVSMNSIFMEFRQAKKLVAVAVTDQMPDALSAVYTFYEPAERRRSPGTHAILHQIEYARNSGLDWLYLGYWIAESRKMNYKSRFRPLQYLINGKWQENAPEKAKD